MHHRHNRISIILVSLILSLSACTSKDLAPDSIGGKEYKILITGSTGAMPDKGSAIIKFEKTGTYDISGDGIYTENDNGTYTYRKMSASTGLVTLTSKLLEGYQESNQYEFTKKDSGTYTATTLSGDAGTQTGSFNQI